MTSLAQEMTQISGAAFVLAEEKRANLQESTVIPLVVDLDGTLVRDGPAFGVPCSIAQRSTVVLICIAILALKG